MNPARLARTPFLAIVSSRTNLTPLASVSGHGSKSQNTETPSSGACSALYGETRIGPHGLSGGGICVSTARVYQMKMNIMKKLVLVLSLLISVPCVSFAAPLTQVQSESLINVVQSSPGTPASAFTNLITAFSNITVAQADSLIGVVQAAPGAAANAFVNLLVAFTQDPRVISTVQNQYANSCNGSSYPACLSGSHFYCPTSGAGYCLTDNAAQTQNTSGESASVATVNTPSPTVPLTSNAPWVDIKADGSDGPISESMNGPAITISWQSKNVLDCGVTSGRIISGSSTGRSGSASVDPQSIASATSTVFTVQCSALVNNAVVQDAVQDSVVVNIPDAIVYTPPIISASMAGFVKQSVQSGATNVKIGEFVLYISTSHGEEVAVNTISLNISNPTILRNVSLRDDQTGAIIGQAITTPSSSVAYNANFGMGASGKAIDVYADIPLSVASGSTQLSLNRVDGMGPSGMTGSLQVVVPLQTISIGSGN